MGRSKTPELSVSHRTGTLKNMNLLSGQSNCFVAITLVCFNLTMVTILLLSKGSNDVLHIRYEMVINVTVKANFNTKKLMKITGILWS